MVSGPGPVVGLLTDFGLDDPYVGQVKAVLAAQAPQARVVDVSHGVRPGAVDQAAFFLAASAGHFPPGAVLVAAVDPGVGSERRLVAVQAGSRLFLAPDNGLLGLVLARTPGPVQAVDLGAWTRGPGVSATFHGRDVLAPLAARLARGESLESLGPALDPAALQQGDWSAPVPEGPGVRARVLHVDRFGNCVLNLDSGPWGAALASWGAVRIRPGGERVRSVACYAALGPGETGVLPGSQGFLELARRGASAALALGLDPGRTLALLPEGEAAPGGASDVCGMQGVRP